MLKMVTVLSLVLVPLTFAFGSNECGEELKLDSFVFQLKDNNQVIASFKEEKQNRDLRISTESSFKEIAKNKKSIETTINIVTSSGVFCSTFKIENDPIKLCRDENGKVEKWRYIIPKEGLISLVSVFAEIENDSLIDGSLICGETTIQGNVHITESNITGGTYTTENQGAIFLEDMHIYGNPTVVSSRQGIFLTDSDIEGDSQIREGQNNTLYAQSSIDTPLVHMSHTRIDGNPIITGGDEGLILEESTINGSPTIEGDIGITRSTIEGNGIYKATAEENGSEIWRASIKRSTLKGSNDFSGFYTIEKQIENSTIAGVAVRDNTNVIILAAIFGGYDTQFNNSTFTGIGSIGGFVDGQVTINGYFNSLAAYGVILNPQSSAINYSNLSGSMVIQGGSIIDNSHVTGTYEGYYPLEIFASTVTSSNVSGFPSIWNSTISDSSVSGEAKITSSQLINSSSATCDAFIIEEVLNSRSVGCGYMTGMERITNSRNLKEVDAMIAKSIDSLEKSNKRFRRLANAAALKMKGIRAQSVSKFKSVK